MREIDITGQAPVQANPGTAPMLDWIAVSQLVLDDSYQRGLARSNWDHIRKIANAFNWARFSPLLVAPVEGGRFAIVDGQHRAHAAALCGITSVPAMIVPMSVQEQAGSFAWVNGTIKRVTPMQMYRAALAAGEIWATRCDQVVAKAGCRLMNYVASGANKKPADIHAVALIRTAIERGHAEPLIAALDALRRYDTAGRVALWTDFILTPWVRAVCNSPYAKKVDLLQILQSRDPFKVMEDASRATGGRGTDAEAQRRFSAAIDTAYLRAAA
jgi:hypothetical protein